ncbi:uncharacterized protein K444DRAFT_628627 [Hyaloscypha bicolor E]|uniref:SAP domain-containing protein n=1 Tax=Hyaloscypha bicolor E TaxID=1095630 RepID=A0A2J6TF34_9HELO|nr:uncharacterized protein K444DRAFT_628627 [Hyaloscypha bicolor E]PMD61609.1 hypothetical protein K444DRAFT_628627 [Hyaloscypha bicolor E]
MSNLRYDQMQISALREKCWDCHLDVSGDKPTLVARLVTFEIENIEAELNRSECTDDYTPRENCIELKKSLQLAIVAKADQVYNVKKQYLLDEVEEIKAELASIKEERDEERIRGMKRYNWTESLTKENGKAVIAQHKKFGLGQERVADREGGELASGGNSTIADTKPKRKIPLVESLGNKLRVAKKFKSNDNNSEPSSEDEEEGDGGYQFLQYLRKKAARGSVFSVHWGPTQSAQPSVQRKQ